MQCSNLNYSEVCDQHMIRPFTQDFFFFFDEDNLIFGMVMRLNSISFYRSLYVTHQNS